MSHTKIGKFEVAQAVELEFPLAPIRTFFPDLTQEMLDAARPEIPAGHITDDDHLLLSFHSFIVKTGRHTVLVDTCCGNDKERPARPDFSHMNNDYFGALGRAGVTPGEVDFVMCTHLHWDHVGWNTRLVDGTWVPTFPNAKYVMARREYEHWDKIYQSGTDNRHRNGFEDSVLPIIRAERAVLVEDDFELEDGVWLEPCPGHTPGNVVINLKSGDARGVLSGDVIHHRIQLLHPELSPVPADTDADLSRKTRTAFIEKHAGAGSVLFPAHFPSPTVGRIEPGAGGKGFGYEAV